MALWRWRVELQDVTRVGICLEVPRLEQLREERLMGNLCNVPGLLRQALVELHIKNFSNCRSMLSKFLEGCHCQNFDASVATQV